MSLTGTAVAPTTVSERWRRLSRRWQAILAIATALVALTVVAQFTSGLLSSPRPPIVGPASSFDTSGPGAGALAQLLHARGHPLEQLSVPLKDASFRAGSTLFVLDPAPGLAGDAGAMRHVLAGGGRLVLAGRSATTSGVLKALGASAPAWRPAPAGNVHPVGSAPEVRGVSVVQTGQSGSFAPIRDTAGYRVLLEGNSRPFALVSPLGGGRVVVLASSVPLEDSALGKEDDAAFGLDLAGPATTPVVFDEYDHGAGRTSPGLRGLPGHWKAALVLALAALVVWLLAASRRFGPAEAAERDLIPARVAHVDAMATLLAAGPDKRLAEAAGPLRLAARERLRRRVGAVPAASDSELRQRAADAGLPPEMVGALLSAPDTAAALVSLGRAAVEIDGAGGRYQRQDGAHHFVPNHDSSHELGGRQR